MITNPIQQLRTDLATRFSERKDVIDGALAAVLAGEHVLAGRELRVLREELEAFLAGGRRSDGERSVDSIAMKILGKCDK
jgi:hypothetical protein